MKKLILSLLIASLSLCKPIDASIFRKSIIGELTAGAALAGTLVTSLACQLAVTISQSCTPELAQMSFKEIVADRIAQGTISDIFTAPVVVSAQKAVMKNMNCLIGGTDSASIEAYQKLNGRLSTGLYLAGVGLAVYNLIRIFKKKPPQRKPGNKIFVAQN